MTNKTKKLIVEIPIEKIEENSYSLNYSEYINKNTNQKQDDIVLKTLGEIFDISKGTLQSSKNIEGEYTFITASDTYKHIIHTHMIVSVLC
jgi:hypothetical protein